MILRIRSNLDDKRCFGSLLKESRSERGKLKKNDLNNLEQTFWAN